MAERRNLTSHGRQDGRVSVTKRIDRKTGKQVQVSPSVRIPQEAAFAAYEHALRQTESVHYGVGVRLENRL